MTMMENGKRKILLCLFGVLLAAVVIGLIYYYQQTTMLKDNGEGVLIRTVQEVEYGCKS